MGTEELEKKLQESLTPAKAIIFSTNMFRKAQKGNVELDGSCIWEEYRREEQMGI